MAKRGSNKHLGTGVEKICNCLGSFITRKWWLHYDKPMLSRNETILHLMGFTTGHNPPKHSWDYQA